MGRSPCCSKVGLRRGPWSTKEDTLLTNFIQEHGEGQWRSLPKKAGLLRCGKSCRLRWMNYLRPGIKRGNITQDEEDLIVRLHGLLGNRWSLIAGRLPGRTDNEIKNYWNTHLLKKLQSAGINPTPHKDIPKPPKAKKSKPEPPSKTNAKKKKQSKQKKKSAKENEEKQEVVEVAHHVEEMEAANNEKMMMKVYLPKPIRISSVFPRTNSYDSLNSGTSSSEGVGGEKAREVASYVPVSWPSPLFELEEVSCGEGSGGEKDYDDFLGVGRIMPVLQHQLSESMSGDVNMWEKVYDEYLQLL